MEQSGEENRQPSSSDATHNTARPGNSNRWHVHPPTRTSSTPCNRSERQEHIRSASSSSSSSSNKKSTSVGCGTSSSSGRIMACAALAAACAASGRASVPVAAAVPRSGVVGGERRVSRDLRGGGLWEGGGGGKDGGSWAFVVGRGGGDEAEGEEKEAAKPKGNANSKSKKKKRKEGSANEKASEAVLKEENYYAILGLSASATSEITQTMITKAYRRRCVLTHPDKMPNADRRAFDKVSQAYDVLKDGGKRKIYDRFGAEGLRNTGTGMSTNMGTGMAGMGMAGMGMEAEILRQMFGSASPFSSSPFSSFHHRHRGPSSSAFFEPRNDDLRYTVEVTLEDLYAGTSLPLILSQSNNKQVQVDIPRGIASGHTITLSGEIDHNADATPGDLVLQIHQKAHSLFTRKGHDLAFELKISFKESICGFTREIRHLDGRTLSFSNPTVDAKPPDAAAASDGEMGDDDGERPPKLIRTGDIHVLKGEGMPRPRSLAAHHHDNSSNSNDQDDDDHDVQQRCQHYGDLYVQYKVELFSPNLAESNLSNAERQQLATLLDKLEGVTHDDVATTADTNNPNQRPPQRRTTTTNNNNNDRSLVRALSVASASDFGRASGIFDTEHDIDDGEEHLTQHHHRRRQQQQQQQQQQRGQQQRDRGFYHRGHSSAQFFSNMGGFGGSAFSGRGADDDGEVQCQQM